MSGDGRDGERGASVGWGALGDGEERVEEKARKWAKEAEGGESRGR